MRLTKTELQKCVYEQDGILHLDTAYEYFSEIVNEYDSYESYTGSIRGLLENTELYCNLKKGSGIYALKKYTFLKPIATHLLDVEGKNKYEVTSFCKKLINNI